MLYKIKKLLAKVPGLWPLYIKTLLPLYRNLVLCPRSEKFYPKMHPKTYTKKDFYQQLALARQSYDLWKKIEAKTKQRQMITNYTHPYWRQARKKIQARFENTMNENFLRNHLISKNIAWGMLTYQKPMLDYLLGQNDSIKKFTKRFIDSRVGKPVLDPINNLDFPMITTGSVYYLFYLAKIVRELNCRPESCLEIGGGYGGFARISRLYNPKITFTIIDLPEMLAIQQLYYQLNFPGLPVMAHYQENQPIKQKALNLIPVWSVKNIKWQPEVFISTNALTEATKTLRQDVAKLNFFGAKAIYIKGGQDSTFKSHLPMQGLIKKVRKSVKISPTHDGCYEILAS